MKTFAFILILVFSLGFAQEKPNFQIGSSLAETYVQGSADEISISVSLKELVAGLDQAVVFLNVVEDKPNYPQAAHKIFASASEEPPIFQTVLSAESLIAGVGTTLSFQLKDNATAGNYSLVIQIFQGANTDPHRVKPEERVAIRGFGFEITEP